MTLRRRTLLAAAPALLGAAATAQQPFPNRIIRIVPFGGPGGPIDTLARVYAEKLQQRWGQSVIVESKPGASGIIAADYVAKAAPDGYTVLMTMPITHINNAILQAKLPYDPIKDFTPLSMLATGGPMLVARADAPYNNLKEFVAYARSQPSLTYGTWGNGSAAHLFCELLRRQTGINLIHAAYKSEAAAHSDLFGKVLDFAWANPATARAQVQGGKMKVIAIAGSRRVSIMPEVPTFAEEGFKGFDIDSWIGVYAPAHLPTELQTAWVDALREITAMPDVKARFVAYGFEPLGGTSDQFAAIVKTDYPRVAELIKAAGVTAH